jgi:PAS domain S-box-containing protein
VELDLGSQLGAGWLKVLDQLGEAVIVLDQQRVLRHVNQSARRLLGYEEGQSIGGRCRLTTRGVDCENSCPLTFALEKGLDSVEGFATVYHTADGRALHLDVTVVPLSGAEGEFLGAVEILRPSGPQAGFFACGLSDAAADLRRRATEIASRDGDLVVVGEKPSCLDMAKTIHRFSGLPDSLFRVWTGSWDEVTPWPPGTMYACGEELPPEIEGRRPDGWRIILGAPHGEPGPEGHERWELPLACDLSEDLPRMIGAWVDERAPGKSISAAALERLVEVANERGFEALDEILTNALAAAADTITLENLPVDGHRTVLVDDLMSCGDPLAALEERVVREVIERCGWRMQDAAERLGISRVTLWRKMKDLGIEKNS